MTRPTPWILAAATVVVILLHFLIQPDTSRRSLRVLPDMERSIPFDAQSRVPTVDGAARLHPVPGTAARGYPAFRYGPTPEEAVRAGRELQNPVDANDASQLARGAVVYDTFCRVCHAADGGGRTPVTARGVPPPPSLTAERALTMMDGQMYHIITLGQGNMAPYAGQIERLDRWRAILHIRTLQQTAKGQRQ